MVGARPPGSDVSVLHSIPNQRKIIDVTIVGLIGSNRKDSAARKLNQFSRQNLDLG